MKLCASINFLFQELPPAARPAAAAEAGFAGIEIQDFSIAEPDALAQAATAAEMQVVLLNTPLGDLFTGGLGLSGAPGRQDAFAQALTATYEAAGVLNPLYVNIGAFRVDPRADNDWRPCYEKNIARAIELFSEIGVMPLIEPMNRRDIRGVMPDSMEFAAELLRGQFRGEVGVQFDVYHAVQRGEDIVQSYHAFADIIRHIQIADVPGRNEPGTGTLDFNGFFTELKRSDYSGFVGAEYRPKHTTAESLSWMAGISSAASGPGS